MELPKHLYLLGGSRHRSTKALRRANRFPRRVFRIGDITVRSNRRNGPVNVQFLVTHFDEIVRRVKNGTLLISHRADSFVDVDELHAIRAVFLGEEPTGPIVKVTDEDESDDDPIDNPDDEEDFDPVKVSLQGAETDDEDELNPAVAAFGGDDEEEDEGEGEQPPAAPETPPDAPPEAETPVESEASDLPPEKPVDVPVEEPVEPADLAEPPADTAEEPVDATTPDPEPQRRWLPEGYEKFVKKDLLKLCAERGIEIPSKKDNETLVGLLKGWLQG